MTERLSEHPSPGPAAPPVGRLPEAVVIGAAKAGTTALAEYLRRHPQMFVSPVKEPEFFSHDEIFAQGFDWYKELFAEAGPEQVCLEASTSYTRWPEHPLAASRLAAAMPDARLIYLLRHPVDRAWSHYVHRLTKELHRDEPVPATFEEHVKRDPVCLNSSRYMDQLEQYLAFYPPNSLLVLFNDDLAHDTAATLSRVCEFLGVTDRGGELARLDTSWYRNARTVQGRVRHRVMAPLKASRLLRTASRFVPQVGRDAVYELLIRTRRGREIARQYVPPPMLPETRLELIEHFRPHNDRLARFLNVDLSQWNR
ncbi:MAG: sulfotransferase [Phycisphaeraceae bacterium]